MMTAVDPWNLLKGNQATMKYFALEKDIFELREYGFLLDITLGLPS